MYQNFATYGIGIGEEKPYLNSQKNVEYEMNEDLSCTGTACHN
jgi:hypothetical protein